MSAMKLRAAAAVLLAAGSAYAQTRTWSNAAGGNWADNNNWNPTTGFPNGPAFDAVIAINPNPYTVTLDQDILLHDLGFTSSTATLDLTTHNLTIGNNYTQSNNLLLGGVTTGSVAVAGTTTFTDATLMHVPDFTTNGPLIFNSTVADEICDTGVHHNGSTCQWLGTGNINMDDGATFSNGPSSTFTISNNQSIVYGMGATPTFTNNGTMVKAAGGGTTQIMGVQFDNPGMLRVDNGTFQAAASMVTQVSGTTLSGGHWMVTGGSTLNLTGVALTTNAADVTLRDAGSAFAAIDSLTTNAAGGSLTFANGRNFSTAGAFTNDGTLTANASVFTVSGSLTNYDPGMLTLTGGTYVASAGGTMQFPGADIRTLDASVTLSGAGSDIRNAAAGALDNFSTIGAAGAFSIQNGRNFTSTGAADFTVANTGNLTVGAGSLFRVAPGRMLTNFSGNTFTGGGFHLAGVLQFDDAAISAVNSTLDLDGPGNHIIDQFGASAIGNLSHVQAQGNLNVLNGQQLMISPMVPLVRLSGRIGIAGSGLRAPSLVDVPLDFTQDATGLLDLDAGVLTVHGAATLNGTTTGNGTINGNVNLNGFVAPGHPTGALSIAGSLTVNPGATYAVDLGGASPPGYDQLFVMNGTGGGGPLIFSGGNAGLLSITLVNGFVPSFGQTFDVLFYGSRSGQFAMFSGLALPNGLVLDVQYLSDRVQLVAVPAPASGLALLTLFGLSRRRRKR